MVITFQPSGAQASATLLDDGATPAIKGRITQWPGEGVIQTARGYGAAFETNYGRGNVGDEFVFEADCSYGNTAAAYALADKAYGAAYNLLQTPIGTLVMVRITGGATWTFAGAALRSIKPPIFDGVRLVIKYTFRIGSLVIV